MAEQIFNLPFDHVAVFAPDMDTAIEYYARFGFSLETRYEDWAMLRDRTGRGIALLAPDGRHPPHYGLKAASREVVEQIARENGRQVAVHRDGSVSVYLKDPAGNALEVVYYPESTPQSP